MAGIRRSFIHAAAAALIAVAAGAAGAQEGGGNGSSAVIGPPQLKDFSITPRERIVTQPAPEPQRQPEPAAERAVPPPAQQQQQQQQQRPAPARAEAPASAPAPSAAAPAQRAAETPALPLPPEFVAETPAAPVAVAPAPAPPAEPAEEGGGYWYFALPAAMIALLGVAAVRRRRRTGEAEPVAEPEAKPRQPRPDPIPRPWLELEFRAEEAAATPEEATVRFELVVRNTGKSAARDVKVGVRMFNAGTEQDKEIGAFFRTSAEDGAKLTLPEIAAGGEAIIPGEVGIPREQLQAIAVQGRVMFVPVVAVNAYYGWGENRRGQTSKSYVVGRELEQPSEKMGAFRLDLGPRVYRTVGQRQHRLARRV